PCGTVSRAKVFGVAGFERQFAVKRFHAELTITNALAQGLSAAARAYGSLEHPRIARMSEFGVAQGQTFTAVEHVAGLDAARLVAEARLAGMSLASGGALALVSQAARAVGYAHGRGLTHLGLAPTNVIINVDGDVKITDFGILAAGLPQRPVDVARLQHRIQYLAPEQVANEATSAATDVFALGVIAYELVTGQRTFRGDTPQQVAQSIMGGPPSEPALPRPIVRVLHRCLARSPFERFPDARALADALDAALRVAPVPGTRKDIGAQVKATMDRLQELHDGEMSGMVALHVGTGPVPRQPPPVDVPTLGRDVPDVPTNEFVRPDVPVPGPSPLTSPANTMPDLPKAMTTIAGMAPPPIPVPPGIVTVGPPPPPQPRDAPATLLGMKVSAIPKFKPQVPTIPPRPLPPSGPPVLNRADTAEPTRDRGMDKQPLFDDVETPTPFDDTKKGLTPAPPPVPRARTRPSDAPTSEMSPLQAEILEEASVQPEAQLERVWRETSEFLEVKI
ncbi:MAG: serine/threonine-protein kinase, partial [Polyangiales bacterium]